MASYIRARTAKGRWHVRIEDLDTPRNVAGAAAEILRTLEAFGMEWDGEVVYQSQHRDAYESALAQLESRGLIYRCGCSRREIADSGIAGLDGLIYPGTCRERALAGGPAAIRIRTQDYDIEFEDGLQGLIRQNLATEIGDFVLRRADGVFSYQLAVVVDDAALGVTEVVRGRDLIGSTARQIYLQRLLDYPIPAYRHVPVVCNERGEKLSKQTLAPPLDKTDPMPSLLSAGAFLGYPLARDDFDRPAQFWAYLIQELGKGCT